MSRIALLAAVAFAALTGSAHAGGWATVELGELPSGLVAGEPWRVELIVKQHGITPMADVTPSVEISDGSVVRTFPARPTKEVGRYVAEVTFPSAGEWKTRFYDGFTDAVPHRLAAPARAQQVGEHRSRLATRRDSQIKQQGPRLGQRQVAQDHAVQGDLVVTQQS